MRVRQVESATIAHREKDPGQGIVVLTESINDTATRTGKDGEDVTSKNKNNLQNLSKLQKGQDPHLVIETEFMPQPMLL